MVSLKCIAATALAALPMASAYVNNMFAPGAAKVGSTIQATLQTSIYIQNWDDFGVVCGIAPKNWACKACVGTEIAWTNFHGSDAVEVPASGNFTIDVKLPTSYGPGSYNLSCAIPYLAGASGVTGINYFSAPITLS